MEAASGRAENRLALSPRARLELFAERPHSGPPPVDRVVITHPDVRPAAATIAAPRTSDPRTRSLPASRSVGRGGSRRILEGRCRTRECRKEGHDMANVLLVLYDDPVAGYPPSYARDDIPTIERYYDGQT